ncbi:MAG: hypothetical protein KAR18_08925 [Spirochaetes bacterium]|nr:hypothetical protein [Spirochaetota bacterium]
MVKVEIVGRVSNPQWRKLILFSFLWEIDMKSKKNVFLFGILLCVLTLLYGCKDKYCKLHQGVIPDQMLSLSKKMGLQKKLWVKAMFKFLFLGL